MPTIIGQTIPTHNLLEWEFLRFIEKCQRYNIDPKTIRNREFGICEWNSYSELPTLPKRHRSTDAIGIEAVGLRKGKVMHETGT